MLSIPWIPTHIDLLLPPVFVEFMYLSPRWLQKIIFFLHLFSRVKVGLKPSFMLEFCLIAMSLHLSSKTLMLLSLPNPWKACWRWFFTNFQDFIPKSAGISPFFMWEDLLLGLIVAKKPSLLVTRRTEVSNRTFRTLGWLFQQPYEQIKLSYLKILYVDL